MRRSLRLFVVRHEVVYHDSQYCGDVRLLQGLAHKLKISILCPCKLYFHHLRALDAFQGVQDFFDLIEIPGVQRSLNLSLDFSI